MMGEIEDVVEEQDVEAPTRKRGGRPRKDNLNVLIEEILRAPKGDAFRFDWALYKFLTDHVISDRPSDLAKPEHIAHREAMTAHWNDFRRAFEFAGKHPSACREEFGAWAAPRLSESVRERLLARARQRKRSHEVRHARTKIEVDRLVASHLAGLVERISAEFPDDIPADENPRDVVLQRALDLLQAEINRSAAAAAEDAEIEGQIDLLEPALRKLADR